MNCNINKFQLFTSIKCCKNLFRSLQGRYLVFRDKGGS